MAESTNLSAMPANGAAPALRGLLVTADPKLARAFQRELARCAACPISFDVRTSLDEARRASSGPYDCVTVDLDGSIAPSEAVQLARNVWPGARIAVLACWWSEGESLAGGEADVVIHKPLRSSELRAFLRSPTGAPRPAEPVDDAIAVATR